MIIKQLSVFLENKSGRLTEVAELLGELDINMSALCIADTAEYGILRMIVNQPERAMESLKAKGFSVSLTQVICVSLEDCPGSLGKLLRILSENDIAIEYAYAFSSGDKASTVIRIEDLESAIRVLQENQVELRTARELHN
jgi:hypothetical protein